MLSKQYLCKKKKKKLYKIRIHVYGKRKKTVNLCEYLCVYNYGGSRFVSL